MTNLLEAVRDEILWQVFLKRKNAILDLDFGTLHFISAKKTVEFVYGCPIAKPKAQTIDDKIPFSAEFDRETNIQQRSLSPPRTHDRHNTTKQRLIISPIREMKGTNAFADLVNRRNSIKPQLTARPSKFENLASFLKTQKTVVRP